MPSTLTAWHGGGLRLLSGEGDFSQGRAAEEERSWTVLTVKIRAGQGEKSGQGPGKDKTTLVNGFWSSDSSSGGIRVINEWTL